jgi:hypothetical protein
VTINQSKIKKERRRDKMNTVEKTLSEIVFKLVAKKIAPNGASDLARRVVMLTAGINQPYMVKIGDAKFFPEDDGKFFFQYKYISVGIFDEEGNSTDNNYTYLCKLEDLISLLQELAE